MIFRSEKMKHIQLLIPREIAWDVSNEIGRLGIVHLEDISDPMGKPFTQMIKRCEELLCRISMMESFLKKKGVKQDRYEIDEEGKMLEKLMKKWRTEMDEKKINHIKRIDVVEEEIEQAWNKFQEITQRIDKINNQLQENKGKIALYSVTDHFYGGNFLQGLSYIVSIVKPADQQRLAKMIFRVSKGYAWANFIQKHYFHHMPELSNFTDTVMILYFPNSSQNIMRRKLQKIVDSFSVQSLVLPPSLAQFFKQKQQIIKSYSESKQLLYMLNQQSDIFITSMNKKQKLDQWQLFFNKQKNLYQTLNKMEIRDQFMISRFYIPVSKSKSLDKITLTIVPEPILHEIPMNKPPSYFETNLFTYPGQQIVQTYGVPRYQQMNPGVFTCITFPFLFGVMFGDIAHGFVLLMFGIFLTFYADKLKTSALKLLLGARYMIVLMGFFAMYCGFIYNDFMGMGLNLFNSCYTLPMYPHDGQIIKADPNCVYRFGIDPIWYRTQNQLMFMNSLKMKLAVIIGVIHMSFGIILKAVNSLHFKKYLDFFFEFIPQIIFMVLMFGYMDFLIVFKWLKYWPEDQINKAPSIITLMINIPLKLGKTSDQFGGGNMWGNSPEDTSQNLIQLIILLVSVVCVPVMLIPKPWIEIARKNKYKFDLDKQSERLLDHNLRQSEALTHFEPLKEMSHSDQEHMESSQIIVHQIIETIQFILGCISNTASYLRLWALSLAHSQLSQVFFNKTIQSGFQNGYSGIIMLIFGFFILAYVTFGVLLCMDTMQCFLHALRLHWVQFQNKFYKADGHKFIPFSFNSNLVQLRESQQ